LECNPVIKELLTKSEQKLGGTKNVIKDGKSNPRRIGSVYFLSAYDSNNRICDEGMAKQRYQPDRRVVEKQKTAGSGRRVELTIALI